MNKRGNFDPPVAENRFEVDIWYWSKGCTISTNHSALGRAITMDCWYYQLQVRTVSTHNDRGVRQGVDLGALLFIKK